MKGLIVSDTHGFTRELSVLKQRYAGKLDFMIHCGDSELQPNCTEMEGFLSVEGNCDVPKAYPNERIEQFGNLKFFIAHGHLLGVRQSSDRLCYRGLEEQANVVCFGHTHFAGTFQEENMIVINPGSLRLPRNYQEGTYVILEQDDQNNKVIVTYYTIAGKPIDEFSKEFNIVGK
ncbi:metallophosphoesterase family protein [Sporolactobacillus kofuensis]|uniref:Phosphoesterase n=1 Tax=Sporolactobacillus kofuensis TaxID=269672 RepID=A0ABW1WDT1_9BACL|nr:metallophosphoesterase [Sporolactobacillus kofuensis]MCO7175995.1 metallophosphoesterase [Sporolactobacillus kofuensis]